MAKMAPRAGENGNWSCSKCYNVNFPHRDKCNRCGAHPKLLKDPFGDWTCQKCSNINFSYRLNCNRCGLPRLPLLGSNNLPNSMPKSVDALARSFLQAFSHERNPTQSAIKYLLQMDVGLNVTSSASYQTSSLDLSTQQTRLQQQLQTSQLTAQLKAAQLNATQLSVPQFSTQSMLDGGHVPINVAGSAVTIGTYNGAEDISDGGLNNGALLGFKSSSSLGGMTVSLSGGPTRRSAPVAGVDGNWKCLNESCGNVNYAHRIRCNRCRSEKP